MSSLWLRKVKVTIEGKGGKLIVEDLKIDFDVKATIGSSQNTGTVKIWNLRKDNRGKLGEEFDTITLEAGYQDGPFGIILKGDIRDAENTLEDGAADVCSTIEVGEGDKAVNKAGVSKTFPKGTKPKAIIDHVADSMKISKGSFVGLDDLPETKRPYTVFGHSAKEMDKMGREFGFYWSIQKGHIEAVKSDKYIEDTILFDPKSGLIGTPTVTDKGLKFKTLLHPKLAPNRSVEVKSPFLDEIGKSGKVRLSAVSFTGSNRGDDFYADCEGSRIENKKVTK
jgi:hypothetical protein